MSKCTLAWSLNLVLTLATVATAQAQAELPLPVFLAPCEGSAPALDLNALVELTRIELMPRELLVVGPAESAGIVVDACGSDQVSLRDNEQADPRTVSLEGVEPSLRPRVAALALAELVRAPQPPVEAAVSPPAPPPAQPAPVDGEIPPGLRGVVAAPSRRTVRLGVGLDTRLFGSPLTLLAGPRAALSWRRFEVSSAVVFARASSGDGDVLASLATAGAGYALLRSESRVDTSLSAAGEVGLAWARGTNLDDDTRTTRAPFGAALMRGVLGTAIGGRAYAQLAVAAGFAAGLVAAGNGRRMTSTHGPFASVCLEIASLL